VAPSAESRRPQASSEEFTRLAWIARQAVEGQAMTEAHNGTVSVAGHLLDARS